MNESRIAEKHIVVCNSEADLPEIAKKLLYLHAASRIFAFYGKMGVGKTTFIKVICASLEVVDTVNSPTFAIINEYRTIKNDSVFHFDMYRIQSPLEMVDIGCQEYFFSGNYCFIEWPEMIEDLLPEETVPVMIELSEDGIKRTFTF